jgi:predicted dehydrogenase
MSSAQPSDPQSSTRRNFLKQSSTALIAGSIATSTLTKSVYAAGDGALKVGLVGCGGRGTGAAGQALTADSNAKLVAMADVFQDQLDRSHKNLSKMPIKEQVQVDDDHKFVGFDAYKHVIEASDVVLLATTPHFRPMQLKAAIEAGRHVFCEKPVAVDVPGVRSVLASTKLAEEKNLSLVSGLCWRYDTQMRATFDELHKGTAGDIVAMQCTYNSGGVWDPRRTRDQCKSEMEYQVRNWYYYTWLSGDFNVEQHVHSLDKMTWAMNDQTPVKVGGSGGRQVRTDPKYGNIYDHFNIVYEYANGVKAFASARHWKDTKNDTSDHIFCTNGRVDVFKHKIFDLEGKEVWAFKEKSRSMYQIEHDELFASIRSGEPINNGEYMANSTMMAIAGRIVAYTGAELTWEELMNSTEDLSPPTYDWVDIPVPAVAIPGKTKFV